MVFQNYALYPHMNVFDNMAFGLRLRKYAKTEIKKRVNDAASILGIEDLLDRKPKALSGGQRQRVAVGRAIVRQPKVFLFDEPLSNLDAKMRVQMRTEITKLHQRLQATMIYVTHDQIEAMTMGDRIVVMNNGKVQQTDTPLKLYNEPDNLFVAGFLGSPPMNFITGELKQERDAVVFKEMQGGTIEVRFKDRPRAREFFGKPMMLGIRPEDIELAQFSNTGNAAAKFSGNCGYRGTNGSRDKFIPADRRAHRRVSKPARARSPGDGPSLTVRIECEQGASVRSGDHKSCHLRALREHVFTRF